MEYVLSKVILLARHSLRTPLLNVGDICKECSSKCSRDGHLTEAGKNDAFLMGRYLREYLTRNHLLSNECSLPSAREFLLCHSPSERAGRTTECFIKGMVLPAVPEAEIGKLITAEEDVFSTSLKFCDSNHRVKIEKCIKTAVEEKISLLNDNISFLESVQKRVGFNRSYDLGNYRIKLENNKGPKLDGDFSDASRLCDSFIHCHLIEDGFLHDLKTEDWKQLSAICDVHRAVLYGNEKIAVNAAHSLLDAVKKEMSDSERFFSYFCGHDSNIHAFLSAIGVQEYSLSETAFGAIPSGCICFFEVFKGAFSDTFFRLSMLYRSDAYYSSGPGISVAQYVCSQPLSINQLNRDEDGLYRLSDFLSLVSEKMSPGNMLDY